jgi:putative ABC transport system permease protein
MFKNYFKVAFRNLWNDKVSSAINIIGLAIGMSCCMLILIYIKDELSYNEFNSNIENIYLIKWNADANGQKSVNATTPVTLAPVVAKDISQVSSVTRMYQRSGQMQVRDNQQKMLSEKRFQEQNVYFADNDLFRIFSISFIEGSPESALSSVNSIVITDEMAKKYFGSESAVGKTLFYDNKVLLNVSAVVKKMPANSDIKFDFLIFFETLYSVESQPIANFIKTDWNYNPAYTYILLKPGARPVQVTTALNELIKKYGDQRARDLYNISIDPLRKMHLYAASVTGNPSTSSITYVYIFLTIALLILLIANLNFINLATARSINRSREVGMRKVLGADKRQLITQFLGENLLSGFISFSLAVIFTSLALPVLNQLTDKQLPRFSWITCPNILIFTMIFLCSSILAGLYPAFFITRFGLVNTIKRKSGESGSKNILRKVLLVTQFCICVLLIIGTILIYQQVQYLRNKPLGFQKEQMVTVPIFGSGSSTIGFGVDSAIRRRMNLFTTELKQYGRIKAATAASALPGQGFVLGLVIPEGRADNDNIFVPWVSVDYNFISTLRIPIVAGRDFSKATGTDHLRAFIISESAVNFFNWKSPQDAIGKNIIRGNSQDGKKGQIIGVVKDFNFNPLDQPMQPLIMDVGVPRLTQFAVSIQPDHVPQTIAFIKQKWEEIFPERVFEYSFLDKDINAQYHDKENLSKMIGYFAVIAVLLSCTGLFSLTSFLTLQRAREIGIRKVLGASVVNIMGLLSRDFLLLVLLAFLIASPIGWYLMNHWLQQYSFRIHISAWVFLAAGIFIFLITALTVSFQAIRSALANPVDSLRTE